MKNRLTIVAALGTALAVWGTGWTSAPGPSLTFGPPAHAQDCSTETKKADIEATEAQALYDCIKDKLLEGYVGSGNASAAVFRDWPLASTNPFVSATHGNRFVNHYINDIGKEAYLKYEDIGGRNMPVGSISAKESFNVNKKGKVRRGPLFLMEKVAAGSLAESDDWKYTLILPNGKIAGESGTDTAKKVKFCHECHVGVLDDQDAMFFPDSEYRVSAE